MARKSTIIAHHTRRPHSSIQGYVQEGTIVSRQPGVNLVDVRLTSAGKRVLRNVNIPHGFSPQEGDKIILVKSPQATHWTAICRTLDADQYGLTDSEMGTELELHPPSGISTYSHESIIVLEWEGWSGASICFEIQHNSTASETGASTFYTRGSYFLYVSGTSACISEERFFRVRSLRYDVSKNESFYSAWSSWISETTKNSPLMALVEYASLMWTEHLKGEML